VVTKSIADTLYNIIKPTLQEQKKQSYNRVVFGNRIENKINIPIELLEWLNKVNTCKASKKGLHGAIVMNCNPFTKGHRYLIEQARKKVDLLYIFVVEEDKSFFGFNDRIEMVRLGVQDMQGVVVIPSGKYILSSGTLPGYFEKDKNPYMQFDATDDLEIFGGIIAKEFEIDIRFAGEEPKDPFTKRYNEYMASVLPKYKVDFCEIPRAEIDGHVISASRVRTEMKENNWNEVKKLVMPEVFEYLQEHYM